MAQFVPQFIEAGFDILNPVQCSAAGHGARADSRTPTASSMMFWGGGVDTQKTLPFGTPAEVRRQVLERCEVFSKNGGFVFNAIHNVQARTPVENIVAMIDAVHEFNGTQAESQEARMPDLQKLHDAILDGDAKTAAAVTQRSARRRGRTRSSWSPSTWCRPWTRWGGASSARSTSCRSC